MMIRGNERQDDLTSSSYSVEDSVYIVSTMLEVLLRNKELKTELFITPSLEDQQLLYEIQRRPISALDTYKLPTSSKAALGKHIDRLDAENAYLETLVTATDTVTDDQLVAKKMSVFRMVHHYMSVPKDLLDEVHERQQAAAVAVALTPERSELKPISSFLNRKRSEFKSLSVQNILTDSKNMKSTRNSKPPFPIENRKSDQVNAIPASHSESKIVASPIKVAQSDIISNIAIEEIDNHMKYSNIVEEIDSRIKFWTVGDVEIDKFVQDGKKSTADQRSITKGNAKVREKGRLISKDGGVDMSPADKRFVSVVQKIKTHRIGETEVPVEGDQSSSTPMRSLRDRFDDEEHINTIIDPNQVKENALQNTQNQYPAVLWRPQSVQPASAEDSSSLKTMIKTNFSQLYGSDVSSPEGGYSTSGNEESPEKRPPAAAFSSRLSTNTNSKSAAANEDPVPTRWQVLLDILPEPKKKASSAGYGGDGPDVAAARRPEVPIAAGTAMVSVPALSPPAYSVRTNKASRLRLQKGTSSPPDPIAAENER